MRNFRKMEIWQKSITISAGIYRLTSKFPLEEKFGLVAQMRRSAVSISSNIAEGSGRRTDREIGRFIEYSISSSFELETQLILSEKFGFIDEQELSEITGILGELQRQLSKYQAVLYGKV